MSDMYSRNSYEDIIRSQGTSCRTRLGFGYNNASDISLDNSRIILTSRQTNKLCFPRLYMISAQ